MTIDMEIAFMIFATLVIAFIGWQVSQWGGIQKSIGKLEERSNTQGDTLKEVKKGVETTLPEQLTEVKEESEKAHGQIGKNIKKSRKKAKKRRQELEDIMNSRFDELFQQIKELGASNNSSKTTNQCQYHL